MKTFQIIFLAFYLLAILIEVNWANKRKKSIYNSKDTITNFLILVGGKFTRPLAIAWGYLLFSLVLPFQVFTIETNLINVIIAFFLVEFIYYWYHRLSHETAFLWSMHHTHHSSLWYNFTIAGRINWLGKFLAIIFYTPLVLIGFSAELITYLLAFSLLYQVILHTQMIGEFKFLEGWFFNTPSAHRVHHASNKKFLDKNYGGAIILFDKIFGTYATEDEKAEYGVTTEFIGYNPFVIQFAPLIKLVCNKIKFLIAKFSINNLRNLS